MEHSIERLVFDFEVTDKQAATRYQDQLSTLFHRRLQRVLQEVLDECQVAERTIQFSRIELDLGPISWADFEEEVEKMLRKRLRQFLQDYVQRHQLHRKKSSELAPVAIQILKEFISGDILVSEIRHASHSIFTVLQHFFLHGRFPAKLKLERDSLEALLRAAREDYPVEYIAFLQEIWAQQSAQTRFIQQVPQAEQQAILRLFEEQGQHPHLPAAVLQQMSESTSKTRIPPVMPAEASSRDHPTPQEPEVTTVPASPREKEDAPSPPEITKEVHTAVEKMDVLDTAPSDPTDATKRQTNPDDLPPALAPEQWQPPRAAEQDSAEQQESPPDAEVVKTDQELPVPPPNPAVEAPMHRSTPPLDATEEPSTREQEPGEKQKRETEQQEHSSPEQPPLQKQGTAADTLANTEDAAKTPQKEGSMEPPSQPDPGDQQEISSKELPEPVLSQASQEKIAQLPFTTEAVLSLLNTGKPAVDLSTAEVQVWIKQGLPGLLEEYGIRLVELVLPQLKKRFRTAAYRQLLEVLLQELVRKEPLAATASGQRLVKALEYRLGKKKLGPEQVTPPRTSTETTESSATTPKEPRVESRTNPPSTRSYRPLPEEEFLYIKNAGVVLLWPFLYRYFSALDLMDHKRQFVSNSAAHTAAHLIEYLATSHTITPEHLMTFNKILCGIPLEQPIPMEVEISDQAREIGESLLNAVVQQWTALKNTSNDGLRGSFLIRDGRLSRRGKDWVLRVDQKPYDILLSKLPWGLTMIKLAWTPYLIYVEWT